MKRWQSGILFVLFFSIFCYAIKPFIKQEQLTMTIEGMKPGDKYIEEKKFKHSNLYNISLKTVFISGDKDFYNNLDYEFIIDDVVVRKGKIALVNEEIKQVSISEETRVLFVIIFPNDSGSEFANKMTQFRFVFSFEEQDFVSTIKSNFAFYFLPIALAFTLPFINRKKELE